MGRGQSRLTTAGWGALEPPGRLPGRPGWLGSSLLAWQSGAFGTLPAGKRRLAQVCGQMATVVTRNRLLCSFKMLPGPVFSTVLCDNTRKKHRGQPGWSKAQGGHSAGEQQLGSQTQSV